MRSLVKTGPDVTDTFIVDREIPEVRAGEVLLKVEACGLCGSDIHAWRSDLGYEWVIPPVCLGHEFIGTIVTAAPDVAGWAVGDRAVVVSIQGCLGCDECAAGRTQRCLTRRVIGLSYDGGMSEFVRVSADYLVRVPAGMSAELGAAVEPLSVAAHGVLTVGGVVSGQKVVVTGAGFVGICCALVARDAGADVTLVGAPRDSVSRLPAAAALGLRTLTTDDGGWGEPDVWVEASGAAAALAMAIEQTRSGGRVSAVGMFTTAPTANLNLLVRREIELHGSYASVLHDYTLVIDLLAAGRLPVESLLEKYSLEDGVEALTAAADARTLKPILIPGA